MRRTKQYWIKERYNPQLGTYYVPQGQMSKRAAKAQEETLYGYNIMHSFDTKESYEARLAELRQAGERVHK